MSDSDQADELTTYVGLLANLFEVAEQSASDMANLSKQECRVISVVGRRQPLIMREIAEGAGLSVTNTTGIVEKLVRKGYAQRERSEQDRRIVCIRLTDDGTRIYHLEVENYRSVSAAILAALGEDERAEMLRMMRKVAERLA